MKLNKFITNIERIQSDLNCLTNVESNQVICVKESKPVRNHPSKIYKKNHINKRYLAEDFNHRCCYCDAHDKLAGGFSSFEVEHFAPKSKFKDLKYDYNNMLYCCPVCNKAKSDKWVSESANTNVVNDEGFLDPCFDEYYEHLKRKKNGKIIGVTKLGEYIVNEIKLYSIRHEINYRKDKLLELLNEINIINIDSLEKKQKIESIRKNITEKIIQYFYY